MSVISIVLVAITALLALATQAAVAIVDRAYPAKGKTIHVTGATLNVVDIGPRDSVKPPIVMIHGASSNLEVMRQPLGNMLANTHRVILIDRPGDIITASITTAVVMVVAEISPRHAWGQPILRLFDTIIGIAVAIAAVWIGRSFHSLRHSSDRKLQQPQLRITKETCHDSHG